MSDITPAPEPDPSDSGATAAPTAAASTPKTAINMHPKLFTALLIGLGVTVVTGAADALSPDVFAALGPWQVPVFSLATTGLAVLGGWLKRVKAEESN